MKFNFSLSVFGLLALICGGLVSAVPVVDSALSNLESHGAVAAPAPYFSGLEKRAVPSLALEQVINNASLLFANQLVGATTSLAELVHLCDYFDLSRLATQGYNITLIKNSICSASKLPDLQSDAFIHNLTVLYSTDIFVTQANASVQGNHFLLCDFFNVTAADSVGLNGTLVDVALQCTLPNDGGPPATTSTTTAASSHITKTKATLATRDAFVALPGYSAPVCDPRLGIHCLPERVTKRAAYVVLPGSPTPTFNYPSSLGIHIDETAVVEKRIQPESLTETMSFGAPSHYISGKPVVTPSPDMPHATVTARV